MKFNSQICTSREQSERLLALGLKKETADMCWTKVGTKSRTFYVPELAPIKMVSWRHTPAWSLHRLIEMIQDGVIRMDGTDDNLMLDISGIGLYDGTIDAIAELMKEGHFNKEYLV